MKECTMVLVSCDKCETVLRKGEMAEHKRSACEEEMLSCPFAAQGCQEKVTRATYLLHTPTSVPIYLPTLPIYLLKITHSHVLYRCFASTWMSTCG